jgi:hypothetical protein
MIRLYKSRWMKKSLFLVYGYQVNIMLNYGRMGHLADLNEDYKFHNIYAHAKGPYRDANAGGFRLKIVEQKL